MLAKLNVFMENENVCIFNSHRFMYLKIVENSIWIIYASISDLLKVVMWIILRKIFRYFLSIFFLKCKSHIILEMLFSRRKLKCQLLNWNYFQKFQKCFHSRMNEQKITYKRIKLWMQKPARFHKIELHIFHDHDEMTKCFSRLRNLWTFVNLPFSFPSLCATCYWNGKRAFEIYYATQRAWKIRKIHVNRWR